jgi:hypothetical protein
MIRKKIHEVIESKDKYEGLTNRIPNLVFSNSKQTTEVKTERNERIKKII